MTIDLAPELEARLQERAQRRGKNADLNAAAQMMIQAYLDWEAQEIAETVEAIKEGEKAFDEGRWRPLADVIATQREKYGYPADWPHNVDAENDNG